MDVVGSFNQQSLNKFTDDRVGVTSGDAVGDVAWVLSESIFRLGNSNNNVVGVTSGDTAGGVGWVLSESSYRAFISTSLM